ncbi:alkaline phosphatase [bacterium]|nr:alkaline phosphatase [bacterium]
MVEIRYADDGRSRRRRALKEVIYPQGRTVKDIRNAAPGVEGETRVLYKPKSNSGWASTAWKPVNPDADFTRPFQLKGLEPNTRYDVKVESRSTDVRIFGQTLTGAFQTAPAPDRAERVVFTVSTGQAFGDQDRSDGFKIYPAMLNLDPHFFVHTGDIVYYDRLAKNRDLAWYHWQRTYSLPTNVNFHRQVASYFIKDDHDTWVNDCWPAMETPYMGDFTFAQGVKIFTEQVPMGEKTYRTYRWGNDLQIWLVEGRDFRSPNTAPDGPEKTIWGEEQKAWFKQTVEASDATFRLLISPTPLVGPDREKKKDNHSNSNFAYEGNELRTFIASQKNMAVICGDRHWQYMSIDPKTQVREYSCGPASNEHAGGWSQDDYREEYHRYLNVTGGFLSVTATRENNRPTLIFRYHDVDGKVLNEDRLVAK